ncbi:MAG: DUF2092 domain-containing protein [Thermodesulfobacteriota bacterium]
MKKLIPLALFLTGLWLCLTQTAFAADTPSPRKPPEAQTAPTTTDDDNRDPAALAELKRATDFLTGLKRFHVRSAIAYDVVQQDGRLLQFERNGDIYIQRPDRFFADVNFDDGRRRQYWYDGKTMSLAEHSKKVHTQVKAPPTIDATLDMLEKLLKEPQPLADLFYSDLSPLERLALKADVVGDSMVNGRPCTHLSFCGKAVDWQLWVEKGATPFIRKLVITYREEPGMPQSVALLDTWETPGRFADDLFRVNVPAGFQWIDVLVPAPLEKEGGQP